MARTQIRLTGGGQRLDRILRHTARTGAKPSVVREQVPWDLDSGSFGHVSTAGPS